MVLVKVFRELNRRKIRYLVAGGVAANLYGSPRITKDLDLWVDLEENNLKKLVQVFKKMGFIPRIPVKAEEFISRENRERWLREKGMLAYTFVNPRNPFENVDILFHVPFSFEKAYKRRKIFRSETTPVSTVSPQDLMAMKKSAGRVQDLADIEILKKTIPMPENRP